MATFFQRLDKFMKHKGLNDNKITVETGISNGLIGKARKRGSLSQENISKILYTYSDLNANWLFTEKGEMLKEDGNKLMGKTENYKELAEAQKKTIELLEKDNARLEKDLKSLEEDKRWFEKELEEQITELKKELKKAYDSMATNVERKLKKEK